MRDPSKRPDASHALAHPFLSGKKVARMIGEEAEYDVFLSYRVSSDLHHCELMYDMLTEKGLKVWWDKKCLQPGADWEEGFCEGLINSRAFVALLSRGGLQNFEHLTESSRCDNVLLEYRLALELQSSNLLEAVFPVMIGDSSGESTDPKACTFTHFFKSGCSPKGLPNIIVTSVDEKLCEHLNNLGLGAPIIFNHTVKDIYQVLTKHQGFFIQGAGDEAFSAAVDSIHSMIRILSDRPAPINGDKMTVTVLKAEWDLLNSKKSELDFCQRELSILRSGVTNINALTSDTAGVIDPSGQISLSKVLPSQEKTNSQSKLSKVTSESTHFSSLH